MVYVEDNFLPLDLFSWLADKAKIKCDESISLSKIQSNRQVAKYYKPDKTAWDLTYRNLNGNLDTPTNEIGERIPEIIERIGYTIKKNSQTISDIDNIHFLFSKEGYEVRKHMDRRFKTTAPKKLLKIYKAFIFSHTEWKEDWGGELCFNSGNFLPVPNRMIFYTIDEMHWVTKIINNPNVIRINFGVRFGDETNI